MRSRGRDLLLALAPAVCLAAVAVPVAARQAVPRGDTSLAAVPVDSVRAAMVVAADTTAPLERRVRALRTLKAANAREAVPLLMRLGAPYRSHWLIWRGALAALAECRCPDLAAWWVDLLTFPRRPVREIAIRGLAMSGSAEDRPSLRAQTRREEDPPMRRLAAWADSLLGVPIAQRRARAPY